MAIHWIYCANCPPDAEARRGCERKDGSRLQPGAGCWQIRAENSFLHIRLADQAQQRLRLGLAPDDVREWLAGELTHLARDEALQTRWKARRDTAGAGVDVGRVCEMAARGIVHNVLACTNDGEQCSRCRRPGCGRKK